jgi:hypothetical protein
MIDVDKVEFVKVVMGFAELRGKNLSLPAVELFWAAMQDWELINFKAAAAHLLKTHDFTYNLPGPKDFEDLRKAGRMTAGEAFAKALEWARTGAYRHPAQTPEAMLIDRVVQAMGGWGALCGSDPEKIHFTEKRFAEHYETIEDATDTRQALPQIAAPVRARIAGGMKLIA